MPLTTEQIRSTVEQVRYVLKSLGWDIVAEDLRGEDILLQISKSKQNPKPEKVSS